MADATNSANPYAAPEAAAHLGDGPINLADMEYLGFWPRVAASVIDNVITSIAAFPLGLAVGLIWRGDVKAALIAQVFGIIMGIAYILVFWNLKAATPGKMVFKAQILDAKTGLKPSGGRYLIRYLGYIPSSLVLGLGFFAVAWDKQKRGWHDQMAGTIVVRPRQGLRAANPVRA